EDGIRDFHVTGVQTCALPIWCGAIEYLSRWRMALAKDALLSGTKTLDRIADDIGYESASAFSTAFRKRWGCSPGRFARATMHDRSEERRGAREVMTRAVSSDI